MLTIQQMMKMLRLGRTMIYQLIDKEGLPMLHFGRVRLDKLSAKWQDIDFEVGTVQDGAEKGWLA